VQLDHIEQETSWQDHGFVRLKSVLGELLAECLDFQHNRPLGESWESTVALVRQAMDAHRLSRCGLGWIGVHRRWMEAKPQVPIKPVSLRAEPHVVGQGKSSIHKTSILRQAQLIRDSSSGEQKCNRRQEKVASRPPRRSSSFVHSRNQSRPRSPLVDNGQQVLRSEGRRNSTTRS